MAFFIIALILILPVAELAVFAEVGGQIGVINSVGLTLLTGVVGLILIRRQGLQWFGRLSNSVQAGETAIQEILEGLVLAVAAILLFLPGFISDGVGLLLCLGVIRRFVIRLGLGDALRKRAARAKKNQKGPSITIDSQDYVIVRDDELEK